MSLYIETVAENMELRNRVKELEADNDYRSVNRIRWAMQVGGLIASRWRHGVRGAEAWKNRLPRLFAATHPTKEAIVERAAAKGAP